MDIPSGEWFFTLADMVVTSYSKERAHINSKELYKSKKILYTENHWIEDIDSKIVAVYTDFYNCNIHRFNLFKNAKIFLVHNSDYIIDENLTIQWLNSNSEITLYAQNLTFEHPRAFVLPIGQANSMWPHGDKKSWMENIINDKDIDVLLTYCENTTHLRNNINNINHSRVIRAPKCDYNDYVLYLKRSKFVICPPGNGPDTHRLWEVLAAGAIPIVLNTDFITQVVRTFPTIKLIVVEDFTNYNYDCLEYTSQEMDFITKNFWVQKIN